MRDQAESRAIGMDVKRRRQNETCVRGRVKKLVVSCMWEGKKNGETRFWGMCVDGGAACEGKEH